MIPLWLLYPLAALGAAVWLTCALAVLWMGFDEVVACCRDRRDVPATPEADVTWAHFGDAADDVWSERAA